MAIIMHHPAKVFSFLQNKIQNGGYMTNWINLLACLSVVLYCSLVSSLDMKRLNLSLHATISLTDLVLLNLTNCTMKTPFKANLSPVLSIWSEKDICKNCIYKISFPDGGFELYWHLNPFRYLAHTVFLPTFSTLSPAFSSLFHF